MNTLLINGKEFEAESNKYIYEIIDGKKHRVSKEYFDTQCLLEVSSTTVNADNYNRDNNLTKKENNMNTTTKQLTYEDKLDLYGVDTEWIKKRFGTYAYKAPWITSDGKEMSGEYLVINNDKLYMIRELLFKNEMVVNELTNFKILGMFQGIDNMMKDIKKIGEFRVATKSKVKDNNYDNAFEAALEHEDTVAILRFKLGKYDLVGFRNEETGALFGVRLHSVYEAERKMRTTPKDLDKQFEERLNQEIKENDKGDMPSFDEVTYTKNTVRDEED